MAERSESYKLAYKYLYICAGDMGLFYEKNNYPFIRQQQLKLIGQKAGTFKAALEILAAEDTRIKWHEPNILNIHHKTPIDNPDLVSETASQTKQDLYERVLNALKLTEPGAKFETLKPELEKLQDVFENPRPTTNDFFISSKTGLKISAPFAAEHKSFHSIQYSKFVGFANMLAYTASKLYSKDERKLTRGFIISKESLFSERRTSHLSMPHRTKFDLPEHANQIADIREHARTFVEYLDTMMAMNVLKGAKDKPEQMSLTPDFMTAFMMQEHRER